MAEAAGAPGVHTLPGTHVPSHRRRQASPLLPQGGPHALRKVWAVEMVSSHVGGPFDLVART